MSSRDESVTTSPQSTNPAPSRNPTLLAAFQENEVRDIYYSNARSKCADKIREFAECATGRTVSVAWACRPQKLAMNGCLMSYATQEERDRARVEWFATREERKKAREQAELEFQAKLKQKREYWGVDEQGRLLDKSKK